MISLWCYAYTRRGNWLTNLLSKKQAVFGYPRLADQTGSFLGDPLTNFVKVIGLVVPLVGNPLYNSKSLAEPPDTEMLYVLVPVLVTATPVSP